jgi:hypothetical protein
MKGNIILEENESIELNFSMICIIENPEVEIYNTTEYYKIYKSPIIYKKSDENDSVDETDIGFIEIWYIEGQRAHDNNLDIVEICDDIERELFEYASAIYKDGYIDDKLIEIPRSNDILILHRIEIEKNYQGKNFGIIISRKIIDYIGYNCGAILIRPSPIQYSSISEKHNWKERYFSEKFNIEKSSCTKKLTNYWKKINQNIRRSNSKDILYIPQS